MKSSLEPRITIFDIQRFSVHDGPGIRTTVFLKGCPLRCLWCQNPEGLEFGSEDPTHSGKVRTMTPADLASELMADKVFFDTSGGGVTFSGGEPLAQAEALVRTARILRAQGVSVAVETALEVVQAQLELVLDEVDLILADLKLASSEEHLKWTGKGNEKILSNFGFLADYAIGHHHPQLIVRTPLIPGHTATEANLRGIRHFLSPWLPQLTWELLDFNPLARAKYLALGRTDYPFERFNSGLPAAERRLLEAAARLVPHPPTKESSPL